MVDYNLIRSKNNAFLQLLQDINCKSNNVSFYIQSLCFGPKKL